MKGLKEKSRNTGRINVVCKGGFRDNLKERRYGMTLMKEKAVEMIQRMPEDNMLYVINILQNLEKMSEDKESEKLNRPFLLS